MKKRVDLTQKTLQSLFSGSHPLAKKYGGKHVFVVDNEILPLTRSKKSLSDFKHLKEKHGKRPVLMFVPQPGASYILNSGAFRKITGA